MELRGIRQLPFTYAWTSEPGPVCHKYCVFSAPCRSFSGCSCSQLNTLWTPGQCSLLVKNSVSQSACLSGCPSPCPVLFLQILFLCIALTTCFTHPSLHSSSGTHHWLSQPRLTGILLICVNEWELNGAQSCSSPSFVVACQPVVTDDHSFVCIYVTWQWWPTLPRTQASQSRTWAQLCVRCWLAEETHPPQERETSPRSRTGQRQCPANVLLNDWSWKAADH